MTSEIVVQHPREQVSAYTVDPINAPSWYVNINTIEWKMPPPLRVSFRITFVAHFLGRRMAYIYEIVELVPGERLVMRTVEGPFLIETHYSWEGTDEV